MPYKGEITKLSMSCKSHNNPDLYARVLAIVQSSGMGKSRAMVVLEGPLPHPSQSPDGESGRFFWRIISKFKR